MTAKEKRKTIRVSFRAEIIVCCTGKKIQLEGDSVNISMSGMFIETLEKISLGASCEVRLSLMGTQSPIELTMKSTVVRQDSSGFGLHFEEMDLDSYSLLKEVVRHNAEDPDVI